MIKSILVAASGSESDADVFETAFAAARPVKAHLDFLHIKPRLGDATVNTPHADFSLGMGLTRTLDHVTTEITRRSRAAERHMHEFCTARNIPIGAAVSAEPRVAADWYEVSGDAIECMTFEARHRDLVVMGRMSAPDGLPRDLLDLVVLRSGRPVLIAPSGGCKDLAGTALVCWNESAEAARACAAALPLLAHARRVIVAGVNQDDPSSVDALKAGLEAAKRQLGRHGISAETAYVAAEGRPTADLLSSLAQENEASLVFLGGYGHSRMRELIFGGCTQHFIDGSPAAVLTLH
jgi:nucleotide-binding universal stress UspA family protein